ncbi:hypothetical protein ACHAPT_013087 [Fusarium lateritium]
MPLLYGEGEKAFIRLQEEIIKKKIDHTLFAWTPLGDSSVPTFSRPLAPSPNIIFGHADLVRIWIEDDNWSDVRLSGVGLRDEYDDMVTGAVPADPFKRYDDNLDPNSVIDVVLTTLNLKHRVYPETVRYEILSGAMGFIHPVGTF